MLPPAPAALALPPPSNTLGWPPSAPLPPDWAWLLSLLLCSPVEGVPPPSVLELGMPSPPALLPLPRVPLEPLEDALSLLLLPWLPLWLLLCWPPLALSPLDVLGRPAEVPPAEALSELDPPLVPPEVPALAPDCEPLEPVGELVPLEDCVPPPDELLLELPLEPLLDPLPDELDEPPLEPPDEVEPPEDEEEDEDDSCLQPAAPSARAMAMARLGPRLRRLAGRVIMVLISGWA